MILFHKILAIVIFISLLGSTWSSPILHSNSKKNEAVEAKSASLTSSASAVAEASHAEIEIPSPPDGGQQKAPGAKPDWYNNNNDRENDRDSYFSPRDRDYYRGDRDYYRGDRDYYRGDRDRDYYRGGDRDNYYSGPFRSTYSRGDNFINSLGWTLLNQQSELMDLGVQLGNRNFRTWNAPRYGGRGGGGYGGGYGGWDRGFGLGRWW